MTPSWFTPSVAGVLMMTGVIPAVLNVYLLYGDRDKPGVRWFLLSMVLGGLWALLFAGFTLVRDPGLTLALANLFWVVIPSASVAMFLLAYEYVSGKPPNRVLVGALFVPIAVLFVLAWRNPANLVFTAAYHVDAAGVLHFPAFGGPVKILVVKVYGYLLFTLAAGVLIGEAVRTTGTRRRETQYILIVFSTLALSTLVKVAELVPGYFDPTSVVFSLSGLAFAVSTHRSGFLKMVTIARERAFDQVEDAIFILDPSGVVLDANAVAASLFGADVVSADFESVLERARSESTDPEPGSVAIEHRGEVRYYSLRRSPVEHFRGTTGEVVLLTDITAVKNRERDLDLFKQVLTRLFRHNLRNDLNVVNGYADLIAAETSGELKEYATRIQANTESLIEQTAKATEIEALFSEEQVHSMSLKAVVDRAVDEVADDASVIETAVQDVQVSAHPKLSLAIQELLENAIVHTDAADQPRVQVYSDSSADMVTVYVEDDGPGIPSAELQVLDAGEETDLRHGSGIGLWLVHWIVKRSDGELVSDVTGDGSRIGIRLHRGGSR